MPIDLVVVSAISERFDAHRAPCLLSLAGRILQHPAPLLFVSFLSGIITKAREGLEHLFKYIFLNSGNE